MTTPPLLLLFIYPYRSPRNLHSFPTQRSSDLDREAFGAREHSDVHGDGLYGGEKPGDVAGRELGPPGLELARVRARLPEEARHAPGEQTGVPQRAAASQQRGTGGAGLLDEAPYGARAALRLAGNDVTVPGAGAGRCDGHRDEAVGPL